MCYLIHELFVRVLGAGKLDVASEVLNQTLPAVLLAEPTGLVIVGVGLAVVGHVVHVNGDAVAAEVVDEAEITLLMLGHAVVNDQHSVKHTVFGRVGIGGNFADARGGGETIGFDVHDSTFLLLISFKHYITAFLRDAQQDFTKRKRLRPDYDVRAKAQKKR